MTRCDSRRYLLALVLVHVTLMGVSLGQTSSQVLPSVAKEKSDTPAEESSKRSSNDALDDGLKTRADVAERLARVQHAIDARRKAAPDQPTPPHLTQQVELLKWLDVLYSNREVNRGRKTVLRDELQRAQEQTESLRTLSTAANKPCSFLELDEMRDRRDAERARHDSIRMEIDAANASLKVARKIFDEKESSRRRIREQIDTGTAPGVTERNYDLAKLESHVSREAVHQRELELEINKLESELSNSRLAYLREQISHSRNIAQFSRAELDEKIAVIDAAEAEYRQRLDEASAKLADLDRRCQEANRTLEQSEVQTALLVEEAAMWTLLNELNQEHVSLLQRVMAYAGVIRNSWRQRYSLVNEESTVEDLSKWQEQLRITRAEVARFQKLIEIRGDERLSDLATIRKRLVSGHELDPELEERIQRQATALEASIMEYGSQLVLIKTANRLLRRFGEELDHAIEPESAEDRLVLAGQAFEAFWNYEITSVDDRPVTVSKVVRGTLLLLMGICCARIFSRILGRRILPRLGMTQGAAVAFQSIAFYLLLTCFAFVALEVINLPLTVFAFMGGAIAIGVGFGSQNVLNNFISGLILLAERPVRAGDLVDIQGLNGTIEHIGARSTRVKTGSNVEIIVPNSTFLENNVTNWTLSDTRIRTVVRVGVAYGSPVKRVFELLRQAVLSHDDVLPQPEPIILFKDFGDNSLMFEAHFWLHMRTVMQGEKVASDIRMMVDELFSEANITISFPQRDVHLDTLSPIEVNVRQMVQNELGPLNRDAA